MHPSIHTHFVQAARQKYNHNSKAIIRAKREGTFELIFIALGQYDLLHQISTELKTMNSSMKNWGKIKAAAHYAGVGERTFRSWLKEGLRHVRLPSGTILIKASWIDEFLKQFESDAEKEIDRIVNSIKI